MTDNDKSIESIIEAMQIEHFENMRHQAATSFWNGCMAGVAVTLAIVLMVVTW